MKKAIKKFLEKLAKENKKQYGNQKLDCCKLGKQK